GVNLWGVIHGVRTFLPIMLEQGEEGHVVNTASLAGLMPGRGIYGVTKQAVVALSESLYNDLKAMDAKIGVSVLCPGWVDTNIVDASRNRPAELARTVDAIPDAQREQMETMVRNFLKTGAAVRGGRPGIGGNPRQQALHHHAPRDGLHHPRALRQHPRPHKPHAADVGITRDQPATVGAKHRALLVWDLARLGPLSPRCRKNFAPTPR